MPYWIRRKENIGHHMLSTEDKHRRNFEMNKKEFTHFVSRGIYYGYPICCINDVCFRKRHGIGISKLQYQVRGHTGFVPCIEHAQQIKNKEIELNDLILPTRKCKHVFPTDDDDMLPV